MGKPLRCAAILAGGKSSRMGSDKALLPVGGISMLERAVRVATAQRLGVIVVGRTAPPHGWPEEFKAVRFIPDGGEAFAGPIAGLLTALEICNAPLLLLGCDMPLLTGRTLRGLLAAHEAAPDAIATMAVSRGDDGSLYAEPTLSIYTPAMLPRLKEMMQSGRRSFQPLLRENCVARWEIPPESASEVLNVNDAETLAQADQIFRAP